jgi:hypothetical protein
MKSQTRSVALFLLGIAGLLLVSSCATTPEPDPAVPFEDREKTYDLEYQRVYEAVRKHVRAHDARIVHDAASQRRLEATAPLPSQVAEQMSLDSPDAHRLHYRARFELVVEGVTVRILLTVESPRYDHRRPVDSADVYAWFWREVDSNL